MDIFFIIAESIEHDTIAVHLVQKKLIKYLTDTFKATPKKIFYVSDGCTAQYKSRKPLLTYAITLMCILSVTLLPHHTVKQQQMVWLVPYSQFAVT